MPPALDAYPRSGRDAPQKGAEQAGSLIYGQITRRSRQPRIKPGGRPEVPWYLLRPGTGPVGRPLLRHPPEEALSLKNTTSCAVKLHPDSHRGTSETPMASAKPHHPGYQSRTEDDLLAGLLISMWSLMTGRFLRQDVPPDQLSADELICFWDDSLAPASGRHAARPAALFEDLGLMFKSPR